MVDTTKTSLKSIFKAGAFPTSADFTDLIDSSINAAETTSQSMAGGLAVSGVMSAEGALAVSGQASFSSELIVSTAAGEFAVVTALATSNQSAPAWAEASAVDTWLRVTVCGRNLAIPLVSASF